jgi:hypothetical protein
MVHSASHKLATSMSEPGQVQEAARSVSMGGKDWARAPEWEEARLMREEAQVQAPEEAPEEAPRKRLRIPFRSPHQV